MIKIAYHCSHEQFTPQELLNYAVKAERAGFRHLSSSDHFTPWSDSQGNSGNAWCWMGSVLSATRMTCGAVSSPGHRYHPVILAQMAATLGNMYPSRFWLALSGGEYLHEQFLGLPCSLKNKGNEHLQENIKVIYQLLEGKEVTHRGQMAVETTKLYHLPPQRIQLLSAALSPESAQALDQYSDGLITLSGPFEQVKNTVEKYRNRAGNEKKLMLKLDISYARQKDVAIRNGWEQWRSMLVRNPAWKPSKQIDEAAQCVTKEDFLKKVVISTRIDELASTLHQFASLGFDQINIHNVNNFQEAFLEDMGEILKDFQ
ncbi:MAG: LLM class flavin-dependent oxidoreductase [Parachlamydiaceae bacterium]